jgi:cytochrome c553
MKRSAPTFLLAAALVVAGAAFTGYSPGAAGQPAKVEPVAGVDLRAAYAGPLEVAEGKHGAQASCASCHGLNGIGAVKGAPHIAGQRGAYLYDVLLAYKAGTRGDETMSSVVKFLSDDALLKAAAYYGSLDPAPPAKDAGKGAPAKADPLQAGKSASAACAGCHGDAGVSKMPGTPSLVGLDPKYLLAAMKAYKGGQRKNDVMKSMLAAATDADLGNLALYYALEKPARSPNPSTGDVAAGKSAAAACAGCHGEQGVSATPATPSLAGQDAQYLAAALAGYKDGSRSDETMKGLAAGLDEAAMKNVAAYYASLTPKAPDVRKPLSTADWTQRCDRCHGVNGNSTDPRIPALAGQREDYLVKSLQAYRSGARKSTAMAAMSGALGDADVEGLAAHYAREKARSVIYVILPGK